MVHRGHTTPKAKIFEKEKVLDDDAFEKQLKAIEEDLKEFDTRDYEKDALQEDLQQTGRNDRDQNYYLHKRQLEKFRPAILEMQTQNHTSKHSPVGPKVDAGIEALSAESKPKVVLTFPDVSQLFQFSKD